MQGPDLLVGNSDGEVHLFAGATGAPLQSFVDPNPSTDFSACEN